MIQRPPVIAVLDDSPRLRKALRRLLVHHGFGVLDYATTEAFVTALPSLTLHCLILDMHISGSMSLDILEAFQTQHLRVPIVVIAGYDEPGAMERVFSLGASAYLVKPLDETSLLAAIRGSENSEIPHEKDPIYRIPQCMELRS